MENIGMKIVLSPPGGVRLNSASKTLRAKASMNLPLVELCALLSEQSCLSKHRQNVLAAQSDVAELRPRVSIRIGRRKRVFAQSEDNQRCVHIGLKAEVAMDVLGKFASTADKPQRCIKTEACARFSSALAGKPLSIVSEKTLPPGRHDVALLDRLNSVGDVEPQERAPIGAKQIARRLATKNGRSRELTFSTGLERFTESVDVAKRRKNERVSFVLAEWYVPSQRQPVNLGHFACHEGT